MRISTMNYCIVSKLVLLVSMISKIAPAQTRDTLVSQRIYENLQTKIACFRRMNATHQIGCSSKRGGSIGVVHLVESSNDLDWILEKGTQGPYIALLQPQFFTSDVLHRFNNAEGRVSGVVFINGNDTIERTEYSPDLTCPNRGYGFLSNKTKSDFCPVWNRPGNGILFEDWNFPIFYLSSENSTKDLLDCYEKFNKPKDDGTPRDWPLCSAQLESFMFAAVDTPTCVRRNKLNEVSISQNRLCDPLGDFNIWSPLVSRNASHSYSNKSVIVIAAKIDAASLFDAFSPGADSAATGITAILALTKVLSTLKDKLENSSRISNVLFILFNGEMFDYIGSSRVVFDMMQNKFPYEVSNDKADSFPAQLNFQHVKYFIEFNQLALYNETDAYHVHRNWGSSEFGQHGFPELLEILHRNQFKIPILAEETNLGVPPSSLQSFLVENPDFPGIVITNHKKSFANRYYNSIFDDRQNIGYKNEASLTVEGIASLVATIARTVEELITGDTFSPIEPNTKLVDDILKCYVSSLNCDLFQQVNVEEFDLKSASVSPYSYYVGVSKHMNILTILTHHLLGYYQGEIVNKTKEDCNNNNDDSKISRYLWLNESCYETTASTTLAISPAFDDVDNYNWKSGLYSTWTESVWETIRMRIFLQPSRIHEILTLVFGIAVFAGSFVLFSWINSNADVIFNSRYIGYMPVPPPP